MSSPFFGADLSMHNRSDCSDDELESVFRRDDPFLAKTWRPFTTKQVFS